MSTLLWIWLALFSALIGLIIKRGQQGGVLLLAYFVGLSMIHAPGALIYLGSESWMLDVEETFLGFHATLLGLSALLFGAFISSMRSIKAMPYTAVRNLNYIRLGDKLLIMGLLFHFFATPVLSIVPSISAVLSAGDSLLPLGFWCWLYGARVTGDKKRFLLAVALMPILPLLTMVSGGFIGFGMYWLVAVLAFMYWLSPRKKWYVLASPLVVVIALSFAVAYFGERTALREAVWIEQADLGSRLARVGDMLNKFEFIDIDNARHIEPINQRLNQNILVGLAIQRHEDKLINLAYGATIPIWVVIPRILWPSKPEFGGSGDMVSDATGVSFAYGTSVGVGQPLEFYINFGWVGVVVGFALFGYLLMRLDMGLTQALKGGDVKGVFFKALPGLALLQPGGSLAEILVAFIAAYVAAYFVYWYLRKLGGLHSGIDTKIARVL